MGHNLIDNEYKLTCPFHSSLILAVTAFTADSASQHVHEENIASGSLLLERFDQFLGSLPDVRKAQALRGALQSENPVVTRGALRYTLNSGSRTVSAAR